VKEKKSKLSLNPMDTLTAVALWVSSAPVELVYRESIE